MSTYFREHLQCGSAQFTVPRSSLPNLLEWTERIQARFKVTIQIQWELEQDIGDMRDTKAIRWVTVQGRAEDCKKAKIYISTFCDPSHKQNFTYPEEIHSELEKMQVELEESYSTVLQFLKRGQLLIKSNDEMNLMMVVSLLEDIVWRVKSRKMGKSESGLEGYIEESHAYSSLEDDLEVDSILDEDDEVVKPRGLRQSQGYDKSAATSKTPLKTRDPEELLKGEPLFLRYNSKGLIPGQIKELLYPPTSQYESSISPDRKKIKSLPRDDQWQEPKLLVTDVRVTDSSGVDLFTSNLNSQQKLAIQRILHRGEYTVSEINRLMQRVGNNWECSDLITMLLKERNRRQIPQSTSGHEMPRSTKLENLKDTQEYLMKRLMTSEPSYHFTERGSSPELLPMEFSTQLPEFSHMHDTQPVKSTKEVWLSEKKSFSDHRPVGKYDTIGLKTKSAFDETDSIIDLSNDVIIIPSESDSEKPIEVSSEESDTPEVFLVEHFARYGQKKTGSGTSQHTAKPDRMGRGGKSLSEEQRAEELRGVVDTLKQELKNLQDKMEREKAEASSHQQVVTLLQQTQQEEMQRQYEQQQQKLLEQQQLFQQQFELQERRLKAEQEIALKRLQQLQEQQQQQQKEQTAPAPDDPSEALVIAPARKNLASPLRPIVIDGSNVAMSHGRGQIFSCRGIAICIHYFQKRGHQDITVFVPQGRRTQNPNQIDRPIKDQKILEQLEKQGLLSFTPSRRIGNNYVNCYDDRFIVQLAVENDGVIVSNDNYRDLMGVSPKWKYVIENRLVMYTFAGDRFMIPDDPLGKSGPRIEQVLRRTPHPGSAASIPGLKKPGSKLQQPPAVGRVLTTSHDPGIAMPQATKAGATPWVAGGVSGAQVVKQGTPAARGRGAPAPHSTGNATSKQKLAAAFDRKPMAGQVARDLTQYPNYEKLMAIFPDNKDVVLQVLTKHGDKDDANELVMLVLAEKEISGSK